MPKTYGGGKEASSPNGAGKTYRKVKLGLCLLLCRKTNSKWVKHLNVKTENTDTARKNIR